MVDRTDEMLPIANVGRMMKNTLPARAKISKEAKETMQECATEFISFVTGEASDKCQKENRKTLSGDDICWALSTLGFDNYADVMTRYLHRYRDYEKERALLNQAMSGGGWCAETSGSAEARSPYSDQQEFGRGENSRRKGPAAEADGRTSGGSNTDPFEFRILGKR